MKPSWQLDYDCWGCGACCRAIGCTYLEGNRCSIYETRPDVCRVGYSRPPSMPVERYLEITRQACKVLEAQYAVEEGVRSEDRESEHQQVEEGG